MIVRTEEQQQQDVATEQATERREEKMTAISKAGQKPRPQPGMAQAIHLAPDGFAQFERWPKQIRGEIDWVNVDKIAESLAEIGLTSYPRIRYDESLGGWVPVVGAHRVLAMLKLNWLSIPGIPVPPDAEDLDILEWQLADQDSALPLKFSERVAAVNKIVRGRNISGKEAAARLGISEAEVSNLTACAQLSHEMLTAADDDSIPESMAPQLARCKSVEDREAIFQLLREKKINRDEGTRRVQESNGGRRKYTQKEPEQGAQGKPGKLKAEHKSGVVIPVDLKFSFPDIKAAAGWFNRLVNDCQDIEELKGKLTQ